MVENELQAQAVDYPVGTLLYLVEYEDGSDVEMPEAFIRIASPRRRRKMKGF